MRRPDSVTATIALTVVVAMVLGIQPSAGGGHSTALFRFRAPAGAAQGRGAVSAATTGPGGRIARHPRSHGSRGQTDHPRRRPDPASPPPLARCTRAEFGQSRRAGRGGVAPSHRSGPYHATTGYRGRSLSARGRDSRAGRWTRRERYLDRGLPCERAMAPRREQLGSAASERPRGG